MMNKRGGDFDYNGGGGGKRAKGGFGGKIGMRIMVPSKVKIRLTDFITRSVYLIL